MSSKSKNKPKKTAPRAPKSPVSAAPVAADHHDLGERVEEVIHVPTGRKPLQFFLVVVLVIFLTAIFAIRPGSCQRAARGTGPAFFTWNRPGVGTVDMSREEFVGEKRKLDSLLRLFRQGTLSDEETARFLILGTLAADAGIQITDNELRDRLRDIAARGFGDAAAFTDYMQRRAQGGVIGFQETLRKQLAGERYLQLLTSLVDLTDPADVEKVWREAHQEQAFDYVGIEVDSLLEDARAEIPDDETLGAWLDGLSEADRDDYEEPPRMRAELIGYLVGGGADAKALLERFPDPTEDGSGEEPESAENSAAPEDEQASAEEASEGEDAAEEDAAEEDDHEPEASLAKRYYDRVFYWRFKSPEPEEAEEPPAVLDPYLSFEEVEGVAAKEAPIYFALERWLKDVRSREEEGETVDLAKEAEELGLSYRPADDALSSSEWSELEGWGGPSLGGRIARLEPGQVSSVLWVEQGAFYVARLEEKIDGYLPPLTEIRDEVAEGWAQERAGDLAVERLAAVRDGFEPLPEEPAEETAEETDEDEEPREPQPHATEAEFAEAVAALGLEVKRRPFMERQTAFTMDPDKDDPAHTYIRFQSGLTDLKDGELAEPGLNTDRTWAYLVRFAGSRDPEPWKLSPGDYEQAQKRAAYQARLDFVDGNFSDEALMERVGMKLAKEPEE